MSRNSAKLLLVIGALAVVFGVQVLRGAFRMGTFKTDDVLLGSAAGTVGFAMIALGATGLGRRWIGVVIALVGIGVGAWFVLAGVEAVEHRQHDGQRQIEIEDRLARACWGDAITDAAPLAELGHGIRKALFLERWDPNNRPRAWVGDERWRPEDVGDAQLIGCFDSGSDQIAMCPGGIARMRRKVDGKLVEARTGKVIAEHTSHGGLPPECSEAGDRSTPLEGSKPADDEMTRWARPFIVGAEAVP
ncbi:hypothetical protein BH11MYX3_BH11MYX3_12640 [soil metagenome]